MVSLMYKRDGTAVLCEDDEDLGQARASKPEEEEDRGIVFEPRLYVQRYNAAIHVLREYEKANLLHKVVDLGCAECKLLSRLKHSVRGPERLIGVDVEEPLLVSAASWLADMRDRDYFLDRRGRPLNIQLLAGDMTAWDERLKDTDAVTCIEVIEHLFDDVLGRVPEAVFGRMRPRVAVFTTPNQEFNRLFHFAPGQQFRHDDHKFEWNRRQFADWCLSITSAYPEYRVHISGIGAAPAVDVAVGCCSQMAVFTHTHAWLADRPKQQEELSDLTAFSAKPYTQVLDHTFPFDGQHCREAWLKSAVTNICDKLIKADDCKLKQVEEAFVIPVTSIYSRLPEALVYLIGSIENMISIMCTDYDNTFVFYQPHRGLGFAAPSGDSDAAAGIESIELLYPAYAAPDYMGVVPPDQASSGDDDPYSQEWYVNGQPTAAADNGDDEDEEQ